MDFIETWAHTKANLLHNHLYNSVNIKHNGEINKRMMGNVLIYANRNHISMKIEKVLECTKE